MRVATYAVGDEPPRVSAYELIILLLAIVHGIGALPTIANFIGGPLPQLLTPLWLLTYLGSFLGLMFRFGINWISWLVRYRILLVVLLIGTTASVYWSINSQMSAERVVHLLGTSVVAIYIGFTIPLLQVLRVFAVVLAVLLFASAAVSLGVPEYGIQDYEGTQVWRGVFNSKNDLGFWAATGVLLYITLSESFESAAVKIACYLMTPVCLVVLVFSDSATSLVALLVGGALSLYFFIASRFQLSLLRMAFIAVLFVALTSLIISNIETNELIGRSGDLTGRADVWRQVIKLIFENPLTGVGYGSIWFPTDETLWVQQNYFDFTWIVFHAHNGFLQVASEVGIPLALISLLMVTQQMIEIFYCQYERRQVGVLFVLGFMTAYLVGNYSEARFLVTRELYWIFFLALPMCMLRQLNARSSADVPQAGVAGMGMPGDSQYHGGYAHGEQGKPWLKAQPNLNAPVQYALPAGLASADALSQVDDAEDDLSPDVGPQKPATPLDGSEIDLGAPEDEYPDEVVHTDVRENRIAGTGQRVPSTSPREPETFDHDDLFDSDRYNIDIDFDITGEWVDIDLDDTER